jgi:hypothetical protein
MVYLFVIIKNQSPEAQILQIRRDLKNILTTSVIRLDQNKW